MDKCTSVLIIYLASSLPENILSLSLPLVKTV